MPLDTLANQVETLARKYKKLERFWRVGKQARWHVNRASTQARWHVNQVGTQAHWHVDTLGT